MKLSADEIMQLLKATSFDLCDMIWWRTDTEYAPVTFLVNCNDCFYWGSADAEEITSDNLAILEAAIADCKALSAAHYAGDLFAARVRKMRPQGACYNHYPKELWPLFDECGPQREIGFGNPHSPPVATG